MTNPMIEKKVREATHKIFNEIGELHHDIWDSIRTALTDMYQMGRKDGDAAFEALGRSITEDSMYKKGAAEEKEASVEFIAAHKDDWMEEGAANMKKRILEALPKFRDESCDMQEDLGYHSKECWDDCWAKVNWNKALRVAIKSIQSQDQSPKECICDHFPIGSRMISAVWYCPVHGSMKKKWI